MNTMPKMKYTVYNTEIRKYLKRATQPLGCEVSAQKGLRASTPAVPPETRGPATAEDAGRYSEFVVKNGKGEIIA